MNITSTFRTCCKYPCSGKDSSIGVILPVSAQAAALLCSGLKDRESQRNLRRFRYMIIGYWECSWLTMTCLHDVACLVYFSDSIKNRQCFWHPSLFLKCEEISHDEEISYNENIILSLFLINNTSFFQARNYIQSLPTLKRREFPEIFRGANPLAINLLELMLELDADKWVYIP